MQNFHSDEVARCSLASFPNFQEDILQNQKVISHGLLQEFVHVVWLIHGLKVTFFKKMSLKRSRLMDASSGKFSGKYTVKNVPIDFNIKIYEVICIYSISLNMKTHDVFKCL